MCRRTAWQRRCVAARCTWRRRFCASRNTTPRPTSGLSARCSLSWSWGARPTRARITSSCCATSRRRMSSCRSRWGSRRSASRCCWACCSASRWSACRMRHFSATPLWPSQAHTMLCSGYPSSAGATAARARGGTACPLRWTTAVAAAGAAAGAAAEGWAQRSRTVARCSRRIVTTARSGRRRHRRTRWRRQTRMPRPLRWRQLRGWAFSASTPPPPARRCPQAFSVQCSRRRLAAPARLARCKRRPKGRRMSGRSSHRRHRTAPPTGHCPERCPSACRHWLILRMCRSWRRLHRRYPRRWRRPCRWCSPPPCPGAPRCAAPRLRPRRSRQWARSSSRSLPPAPPHAPRHFRMARRRFQRSPPGHWTARKRSRRRAFISCNWRRSRPRAASPRRRWLPRRPPRLPPPRAWWRASRPIFLLPQQQRNAS
mmetsp:Transcript_2755/g.8286  ORF Transcript_2755/g.8286 Transcript_2755/m.8286 type:complete len:428 (+) Transcript_2755:763-2046(+)